MSGGGDVVSSSSSSVSASKGAMEIEVHPLVVMSIADHSVRLRVNAKDSAAAPSSGAASSAGAGKGRRALGLLFGTQDGRSVKVLECVELADEDIASLMNATESTASASTTASSGGASAASAGGPSAGGGSSAGGSSGGSPADLVAAIAAAAAKSAIDADIKTYTASYPNFECLGWYSTGRAPAPADMTIHKRFQRHNERPIYLLLDVAAASETVSARDIPIAVYEESVHVVSDKTTSGTLLFIAPRWFRRSFVRLSVSGVVRVRASVVHCGCR
jgi:hypothetical protein